MIKYCHNYLHSSLLPSNELPPVRLSAVPHRDPLPHLHHIALPGLQLGGAPADPVPHRDNTGVTALLTKAGLDKEPEN